jgi:hypothetical protein
MVLKEKWRELSYWKRGAIIGGMFGIIVLLTPMLYVSIETFMHYGQPTCPRWENNGSPICDINTLGEDVLLIYYLLTPLLVMGLPASIILGALIGFIVYKTKKPK